MKLKSQTDYAIRMLMYCNSKHELATVGEIAVFYKLPEKFLFKILNSLTANGFVETVRGRSGGIRLSRPANRIRLGDIIQKIEGDFALADCFQPDVTTCPLEKTCGLHEALDRALQAFFDILNEYTLDDLTRKKHNIHVLLELHKATQLPFVQ